MKMFGSTVKYAKDVDGLNDRLINMMKTDLRTHIHESPVFFLILLP